MTTTDTTPTSDAVRARRSARAERARRERMLARRRRAVAAGAALLAVALGAVAFAVFSRPPKTAASPEEAGALRVTLAAGAAIVPDRAVAAFAALAKELAKPKEPVIEPLSPAPGVRTILVDKGDQLVTLYAKDGSPVDRFPCASGKLYPRIGTYTVFSRKPASMSTRDDSRFYHFVIFTKSDTGTNIGFHSIPIDPKGVEIGGLGKPISHGCVRLAHEKAEFVYGWAANGTKVIVRN